MNTVVTSKEEILKKSRELIQENGWASVNIRSVAVIWYGRITISIFSEVKMQ